MTLANGADFQLHVPLGPVPRVFVPPISRREERTFLSADRSLRFRTAKMNRPIFREQYRGRQRDATSAQRGCRQQWKLVAFRFGQLPREWLHPERVGPMRFFEDGRADVLGAQQSR